MNLRNTIKSRHRILVEFKKLYQNLNPEYYHFVEQEGKVIVLALHGPKDTIYENNTYYIQFEITEQYPFEPPNITCLTPIIHPNIYNGAICVDILQSCWTPILQIDSIMIIIHNLLSSPDTTNDIVVSKEHAAYKKSSMRHVQVWSGRRNLIMYLAGIGLLKSGIFAPDRFHEVVKRDENRNKPATIKVMSNSCYLYDIFSYL